MDSTTTKNMSIVIHGVMFPALESCGYTVHVRVASFWAADLSTVQSKLQH
uniref:Uncharacterized protein n=1 Tax=Nelumbo nucifera TaxID=4432 RepID=A0A822ZJ60_NELNU|nr:TPA_asm: hypothetical protein HUJ06_002811 [Nelumbo nucifera]